MRFALFGWRRAALLALLVTAIAAFAVGCGDDEDDPATPSTGPTGANSAAGGPLSGELKIEGSSTVAPYTRRAIEAFEELHPDVTVATGEIGSGGGITAFIDGEVAIAAASRQLTEDEMERAEDAGIEAHETKMFDDALVIVANPGNKVTHLTVEQVARIFAGEIRDWSEVGGDPGAIAVYATDEGSGTFAHMQEVIRGILGGESTLRSDSVRGPVSAGLAAVREDRLGISYAGLGNIAELPQGAVKVLGVARDTEGQPVIPSGPTVKSGEYPLVHGLYYYTDGDPAQSEDALVQSFIEFVLSPDGQALGEQLGLVPAE